MDQLYENKHPYPMMLSENLWARLSRSYRSPRISMSVLLESMLPALGPTQSVLHTIWKELAADAFQREATEAHDAGYEVEV